MKKVKYIIAVVLLTMGSSCTKNFSEMNTNPNTAEKVLAENLLPRALVQTVSANLSRSRNITNELMQVTVNTLVETDRVFRYDIRRNVVESPWNGWYAQLTNFKDVYKYAEENKSDANKTKAYMAISLICQSWIYSIITDTFGDVPYSESNRAKEGIYMPVFDRQKDIYADIFAKLEEANNLLKGAKDVDSKYDPVYKGKVASWRKFGNSLYLRLLMRVSGKAEVSTEAIDKIKDIVDINPLNYPLMESNDESAIMKFTGIDPYISPFASLRDAQWRYPKACSFFVEKLDLSADPCLSRWLTQYNGLYEGIPSGYVSGETPGGKSYLQNALMAEPLTGNMMNYGELQLILAEAALKGWISSKTAKDYYEAGVNARVTLWGRSIGTYLSGNLVKWNDPDSFEQKMEKIHWQKYLTLFFTDMQAWIEYRRTGYPVLPKGPGLRNDGIMPTRLYYPLSIQAANRKNYDLAVSIQGEDDLKTKMWWELP
ncbi:SusD/RagB family nutrient-binding outer membrane lipoprotein [Pseudopedobacter beijingensis]|uniref:SusD/RagB family nutrient-binding outer membrane lipoprotein n=1 Tax=Pseudopedobacter beijingensis TaxID=1207056 RepID=A0ABW4IAS8_9SPHI